MPSAIALIGARAGSERVPGKNIRRLAGHPLLAYAIATRQWGFLVTAVAYAVVYARLLRRAYRPAPEASP